VVLSIIAFTIFQGAFAQGHLKDTVVNCKMLTPAYSFQLPGADMAKEFGVNSAIGLSFYWKFSHNLLFGIDANYFFGTTIKDDSLFKYLKTSGGSVLGIQGIYSDVALYERGYNATARFGKVFPVFHSNPNSGLVLMAGAGFIQHKIRIVVINSDIPELTGDYLKGYDHLTNGFCFTQYLGYQHLGKYNLGNFSAGIEAFEGFTKNRRTWNFDSMGPDNSTHFDVLIGVKVGFILPFYSDVSRMVYTY